MGIRKLDMMIWTGFIWFITGTSVALL